MEYDKIKNDRPPAHTRTEIRWGRVNHNYKQLRIAVANALSRELNINKAYFVKVYRNGVPECLLLITDGDISNTDRFFDRLSGQKYDVPLQLRPYAGVEAVLARIGLQPFFIKSGYGGKASSVPLDNGQIFFLAEYRDDAGLLAYSLDFERASDMHIHISADEACRLTARLQKRLNSRETSFAALLTACLGDALHTSSAMLDDASELVLKTYRILDEHDVIYDTFHFD